MFGEKEPRTLKYRDHNDPTLRWTQYSDRTFKVITFFFDNLHTNDHGYRFESRKYECPVRS